MKEAVVCIHGIWMKSWMMQPLAHYLHNQGHHCRKFSYQSIGRSPAENAQRLSKFVKRLDADIVHFIGHSLGGILLLHYFNLYEDIKPGSVVMMGTPLNGSRVAREVSRNQLIKYGMGKSANALMGNIPAWKSKRPLAVFAGTRGHGIGKLLGAKLDGPNDGTVAVSETIIENCTVHVEVPYSHSTMLMAKPVAVAIDEFLRTGDVA